MSKKEEMKFEALKEIVNLEVEVFLSKFFAGAKFFENTNVKNNLLHAGEYGVYKEEIFRNFASFALPKNMFVGDGFVVNSKKEITTQCDVVIYDGINGPLIFGNTKNKFFPNEIVFGIGEMKSKLTTSKVCASLLKLSKCKKIRYTGNNKVSLYKDSTTIAYDTNLNFHNIFTFLICDEITDFKDTVKFRNKVEKMYDENGIEYAYRHNVIVSLKNGLILYKTNDKMKKLLKIEKDLFVPFPSYMGEKLDYYRFTGNQVDIIKQFVIHLNNSLKNCQLWYPEPGDYIV